MQALPIDAILPDALRALAEGPRLVLEAPPGAGKTTRLPWAIASGAPWCQGRVIVTEPRRIAAHLAARRVAEEQGLRLGGEVGYQVRFEDVTSASTRVVYVTEGVLLRRLALDPTLRGVACVILDELHERSLDADLCLALLERTQRTARTELRLVAMSATLEGAHVASYLGDCPRLRSEGRTYDIDLRHAPAPDDRPLEKQVRSAVREAIQRDDGDTLVFLPGAAEIRRCQQALAEGFPELEVVPLHGDLPIADQTKAVSPSVNRRVVLATNVAESSVTIPSVTTVIDSGLARVSRHSPWSGLTSLELEEISQARATQRAGRAGRVRAGVAVRLYTQGNFSARPRQDAPAIEREELSEAVLTLASLDLASGNLMGEGLRFLTTPPAAAVEAAVETLESLGALRGGRITDLGRRLLDYPVHPRLARLIVEGERLDCFDDACLAAALLSDRDIRRESRMSLRGGGSGALTSADSDVEEMIDRFREAQDDRFERRAFDRLELDGGAVRRVERAYKQLARRRPRRGAAEEASAAGSSANPLGRCVLSAFSDRVAQRRGTTPELLLCGGGTARLAETSVVHRAMLVVAVAADQPQGKRGQALVRIASRIEPEWLLDGYADRLELEDTVTFDAATERVERISRMRFGRVVLDESRSRAEPGPEVAELLLRAARAKGLAVFDREDRLSSLGARVAVLAAQCPELAVPENLGDLSGRALELGAAQVSSLAELEGQDLAALVHSTLPAPLARALVEETPPRLRLPGGREVTIHYESGKGPWIESRLQDFFGMTKTPTICRGRLPLTIHLLAPNYRAVQVTTDLDGFWTRHYATIRKELMRRYPRHDWPEDGRTAKPPAPKPPRAR
jgi:ATP-dependent helicase HrpB